MEESNDGDDGDGNSVQPVVVVQQRPCYIDRVPNILWKRLALFLAWRDAASLHAGSRAIRTLMLGKWSPHLTVAAERVVLAAAAASADNSWRQLGWDSKNPVGVTTFVVAPGTNSAALVERIVLSQKGLRGELSKALGNLANLTVLNLGNNSLSGVLPKELGQLINLKCFDVSNNSIGGELPMELGNLVNLTELLLQQNAFQGALPKKLGQLVNLKRFDVSNNSIGGELPKELGNLINLKEFDVSGNSIGGELPKELGNLVDLTALWLSDDAFQGELPKQLGNLVNLTKLFLNDNQFRVREEEKAALRAKLPKTQYFGI